MYSLTFTCSSAAGSCSAWLKCLLLLPYYSTLWWKSVHILQNVWASLAATCQLQSQCNKGNACCHTPWQSSHAKASAQAPVEVFKPCQLPSKPKCTVAVPKIIHNVALQSHFKSGLVCVSERAWSQDQFYKNSYCAVYLWMCNYFFIQKKKKN